jgi:dihydropteroate synthase
MQGQPRSMQHNPAYNDVVSDVAAFLQQRVIDCDRVGIGRERLILDPGFGFGKSLEHNYQLLSALDEFHSLGVPILAGMSRKSMLFKLIDKAPNQCVAASVAAATIAAQKGAQIIRVHDVAETVDALKIVQQLQLVNINNKG